MGHLPQDLLRQVAHIPWQKKLSIILSYGDYLWQISLLWEARSWQKLRHWLAVTNFIDKLTRLTRSWQGIKPRGCEVDGGEEGSQRGPRGWPYRAISSGLGLDRVRPAWLIESLVKRQGWAPARRCFPKETLHRPWTIAQVRVRLGPPSQGSPGLARPNFKIISIKKIIFNHF